MQDSTVIFDRQLVRTRRNRAAAHFDDAGFVVSEACERLSDRLEDINRHFPLALDLGCHTGQFANIVGQRGGIETLVHADMAEFMVAQVSGPRVVCDEEFLPFADNTFDLVISAMSLHWVNDLPGTLIQIRRILKPDGLFLAVLPGAQTLKELRESFTVAMMAEDDGVSPRISPFIDVQDGGALLQRAGFALPVIDTDMLTITYEQPITLLQDLRNMGETNTLTMRARTPIRRNVLGKALAHYQHHYSDREGRIPASVELITLTAWKPHASQQKPLARGSATARLSDFVGKKML